MSPHKCGRAVICSRRETQRSRDWAERSGLRAGLSRWMYGCLVLFHGRLHMEDTNHEPPQQRC